MPKLPDRWLKYSSLGQVVEGTRFVAFKVPLHKFMNKELEEPERFYPWKLLEKLPKLGMIIDLTNTTRYYDPEEFVKEGVVHKKIKIPGHATPPSTLVNQFKDACFDYLSRNKHNDKLIGVHCTHGVNRTGYLICNYMITEMHMRPKDAIARFNLARGHDIERRNYIDHLHELGDREDADAPPRKRSTISKEKAPVRARSRKTSETKRPAQYERSYSSTKERRKSKETTSISYSRKETSSNSYGRKDTTSESYGRNERNDRYQPSNRLAEYERNYGSNNGRDATPPRRSPVAKSSLKLSVRDDRRTEVNREPVRSKPYDRDRYEQRSTRDFPSQSSQRNNFNKPRSPNRNGNTFRSNPADTNPFRRRDDSNFNKATAVSANPFLTRDDSRNRDNLARSNPFDTRRVENNVRKSSLDGRDLDRGRPRERRKMPFRRDEPKRVRDPPYRANPHGSAGRPRFEKSTISSSNNQRYSHDRLDGRKNSRLRDNSYERRSSAKRRR